MIKLIFTPSFMREAKRLPKSDKDLGGEIAEKIELFRNRDNHTKLKVHKLHGPLVSFWSFSVNYKYRIIFESLNKNEAILHDIGDHDVYK